MSNVGQTVVAGHGLQREGRAFAVPGCAEGACGEDLASESPAYRGSQDGHGLCACGTPSPHLPTGAARQRWHYAHKELHRP